MTPHVLFALASAGLAGWSLLGWMAGVPVFTSFLPGRPALSPMTALVLLLAATAAMAIPSQRRLAWVLAVLQLACGAGILAAHAGGVPGNTGLPAAWWSSRLTGAMFTLSGTATVLLASWRLVPGQLMALGVLVLTALTGLGHAFPGADLYNLMPGTGVAIPTVLAFAALSVSQLLACKHHGITGAMTSRSPAGRAGLRLLLAGLLSMLVLAALAIAARRQAVFDADTAILLVAWGATVLLGSSLWGLAVAVSRAERARAAAEEDRDRMQQMVAAAVTHDLRNPLSVASMSAMLLERFVLDPQGRIALQRQQRSHRRLDRLLRSLLDSLAVGGGRPLHLKMSPMDLGELVAEVVAENETALGNRVAREGAADGWWDRDALFRVIENLLLNAAKYGEDGTPIDCRIAAAEPGQVTLSVQNRGAPIPVSEWEAIFRPFARGSQADSSAQTGWGVGLAYARAVAIAHGGGIHVARSDGEGTTFELRLPIDARPAGAAPRG